MRSLDRTKNMKDVKSLTEVYNYIIYHKNCLDGFAGFFLLTKTGLLANNPYIYPDQPSSKETPPNLQNKNVIIIDVAYNKDILENIILQAKHVTHIDHHISIRNDVINLEKKYKKTFTSVFDLNESGVSLVWTYFYKYLEAYSEYRPKFVKYIKDNDIGQWRYKNTAPFVTAISVDYNLNPSYETLKQWDNLFDNFIIKKLIRIGHQYINYEKYLLNINTKRYTIEQFPSEYIYSDYLKTNYELNIFSQPGQYKVAVVNGSGCPSGGIVAKKILSDLGNNCDFCILWTLHLDKKEIVISFRSTSVDVGDIAKYFGGGGHRLAAACSIPLSKYNITDLFYPASLPRK